MTFQTEFPFTLPRGFVDGSGLVHREGTMRLARAIDEVDSAQDPRVLANEAFLPILLLSRVVTRLGTLESVTPQEIAALFASDLVFLETLYQDINRAEPVSLETVCPACQHHFLVHVAVANQSRASILD